MFILKEMQVLKWDGSDLGKLGISSIEKSSKVQGLRYILINVWGIKCYCIIKSATDRFSCVIDELKEVFSITKLGTHTIKIDGIRYLLIRAQTNQEGDPVYEHDLGRVMKAEGGDPKSNDLFRRQVQEILAFRYLMTIKSTNVSSIKVRANENPSSLIKYYPISFKETSCKMDIDKSLLPFSLMDYWFTEEETLEMAIRRIVPRKKEEETYSVLSRYSTKIEKIVKRVDKKHIWIVNGIMERIKLHI